MRYLSVTALFSFFLFLVSVADARTAGGCCRRQPTCICVFPEAKDSDIRRSSPGAVELVRLHGGRPPAPTLFALRYKPHPKRAAQYGEDPATKHMMQVLHLQIEVTSYYPIFPSEIEIERNRKAKNVAELGDCIATEHCLPSLSVNGDHLAFPTEEKKDLFHLKQKEALRGRKVGGGSEGEDALVNEVEDDDQDERPSFVHFDPSLMNSSSKRSTIPERWMNHATLHFRLNETSVLRTPALLALRWHGPWRNTSAGTNGWSYDIPAVVNVSVVTTAWGPNEETPTLGEYEVKHWKKSHLQVIADPELLQGIREEEEEKAELPPMEATLRTVARWKRWAARRCGGEGKFYGLVVVLLTILGIWLSPRVRRPLRQTPIVGAEEEVLEQMRASQGSSTGQDTPVAKSPHPPQAVDRNKGRATHGPEAPSFSNRQAPMDSSGGSSFLHRSANLSGISSVPSAGAADSAGGSSLMDSRPTAGLGLQTPNRNEEVNVPAVFLSPPLPLDPSPFSSLFPGFRAPNFAPQEQAADSSPSFLRRDTGTTKPPEAPPTVERPERPPLAPTGYELFDGIPTGSPSHHQH